MRARLLICAVLMAVLALLALAFWGATLGPLLLLAISAGCLFAMIYSWRMAKKIDRQLDKINRNTPNDIGDKK